MGKKLKSKKRNATNNNNFDKSFDSHLNKNNVSVIKDNNNSNNNNYLYFVYGQSYKCAYIPKFIKSKKKQSICGKTFTLKKNLFHHIRECHTKKNFLACPFCMKKVPRLREHINRYKNEKYISILK